MGRGKEDTCSNCIFSEENREKRSEYICKRDKSEVTKNDWCKYHCSPEERG